MPPEPQQGLKGVLPKVYARQNLDPTSLGELIDLISNIALGDAQSRSADVLGHVFEYFLGEFALVEGKKGGQFYTPRSVMSLRCSISPVSCQCPEWQDSFLPVARWSGCSPARKRKDGRWQYGTPPTGNANYAWIQHFIYHLAPSGPVNGNIVDFPLMFGDKFF
jgi:type I restriction-modification system DNA methylase subunit